MRQVVLDTETTGLEPELNHRVIEIGCVELVNRRSSGRSFHRYLNPERDIDDGALAVHGISRNDLDGQPRFADIAEELLAFLAGAELPGHAEPSQQDRYVRPLPECFRIGQQGPPRCLGRWPPDQRFDQPRSMRPLEHGDH